MAALRFDPSRPARADGSPSPLPREAAGFEAIAVSDARSGASVGQLLRRRAGGAWEPDAALREAAGLDGYFREEYRGRVSSFGDLYPGRVPGGYLLSVIGHVRAAYARHRQAGRSMADAARQLREDPPRERSR